MTISRRHMLMGSGAAVALNALSGCASFVAGETGSSAAGEELSSIAEALLASYPEGATGLGLDKAERFAFKGRLADRSLEGRGRLAHAAGDRLARLRTIDRSALDPAAALDVDVAQAAHEIAVQGFRFPYGEIANLNLTWGYRNSPYAVSHNHGAWAEIPDFLDSAHVIENAADADAYVSRLEAYASVLDGETERLRHDAGLGVVAPAFILDKALRQQKASRPADAGKSGLVTSLARRSQGFGEAQVRRAERLVAERVLPAIDRQYAELQRHRAKAKGEAGAWKLPQGDAFYAWALHAGTTTNMSPEEVHQRGLDELRALQSRMDTILRAQGLTQGSVGARMTALGKDPRHLFPNSDAGRAEILAYINGRVADIRERLPRAFATLVPGRLEVKRVPVEIEEGAPGGYAAAGTIDGSVPGNYYINLRDTSIWPRYALPTLSYHEGIPGHIWQGEYTYKLPLIRSLLAFNAYSEGWALYAEQLGDELGVYEGDPFGELGYLQSISFRACRLVVDTGLHAKKWTREQAIRWFAETNGSTQEEVQSEVDRYCVWPGQACGYKVGHSEIVRLREKARVALGDRFDFRQFNDAVVLGGAVPLTSLEKVIDRHIAGRG